MGYIRKNRKLRLVQEETHQIKKCLPLNSPLKRSGPPFFFVLTKMSVQEHTHTHIALALDVSDAEWLCCVKSVFPTTLPSAETSSVVESVLYMVPATAMRGPSLSQKAQNPHTTRIMICTPPSLSPLFLFTLHL